VEPELLWSRLIVASIALVASTWMFLILVRDSRAMRLSGINGEVLHAYEGLRSAARSLMFMAMAGGLSAIHPSWRRDRALIWVLLVGVIWMSARMYLDRRKAELLAGQRLARRGDE